MLIAYTDQNDCDFAVKFDDETKENEVRKAIQVGIDTWYEAAHTDIEGNEYFTKEEIEAFYESGYAEPTCEILDKLGIEYEIVDVEYNDNDEVVCDELM